MPRVDWCTVETGMVNPGVPDSNFCYTGTEGWIEHKWTDGWEIPLKPEQIGWHARRGRAGGRVFVAVRRLCSAGPRRPAADELWLWRSGSHAAELKIGGLRGAPREYLLGVWSNGPAAWDWPMVLSHLIRSDSSVSSSVGHLALVP